MIFGGVFTEYKFKDLAIVVFEALKIVKKEHFSDNEVEDLRIVISPKRLDGGIEFDLY